MEDINVQNDYENEIKIRERILQKIREKIAVTPEERLWLVTHPIYNERFGKEVFSTVIERIEPNEWYLLRIKIEKIDYSRRIIPIIEVPAGKGKIITDLKLYDVDLRPTNKKEVKMLGIEIDTSCTEYTVRYISDLGLLTVGYECDFFDSFQNTVKRESSFSDGYNFAIKRKQIDEQTIEYFCKSPVSDNFNALVFTLRAEKCN